MQLGSDTTVLITGGGLGLGEATARRLAETGTHLVLVDLPGSPAQDVADQLPQARFVPADVTDVDAVQGAVDAAAAEAPLRVAVNCAGVATPGRVIGKHGPLDLDAFRKVVEINLVGTFNVMRLAAEKMMANEPVDGDRGLVVMTASCAAYDGQIGQAAYSSSKGAIVALTITAARDLADKNIRVMTIAPGVMDTPMMAGLPNDVRGKLEALVPHPSRLGQPDEYALTVEQIVAKSYLNDEVIRLDGALRMPPR